MDTHSTDKINGNLNKFSNSTHEANEWSEKGRKSERNESQEKTPTTKNNERKRRNVKKSSRALEVRDYLWFIYFQILNYLRHFVQISNIKLPWQHRTMILIKTENHFVHLHNAV